MKKVAIIIAHNDFQDDEYFVPKEILEGAGVEVRTVSNKAGTAAGFLGGEAAVDILLEDLNVADFDAIIFVGGAGCLLNLNNENSYKAAQDAAAQGKILASICISPVVLAKSGVLKGKRATVWSSALDKSPIKTLEENGAVYSPNNVVQDGKLITADGPSVAKEFGETILRELGAGV